MSENNALGKSPEIKIIKQTGEIRETTDHTLSHLGLQPSLRQNIRVGYYEAGHMMYIHNPSLRELKKDLSGFIQESAKRAPRVEETET